jgi:hypothetical protein
MRVEKEALAKLMLGLTKLPLRSLKQRLVAVLYRKL